MPGTGIPTIAVSDEVREALWRAAAEGTRIASICSGTFVLAATGLLDGLRATTHWAAADALAAAFPGRVQDDLKKNRARTRGKQGAEAAL